MKHVSDAPTCKFCFQSNESSLQGSIISPCLCTKKFQYAHTQCLKSYIRAKFSDIGNAKCLVCDIHYKMRIHTLNRLEFRTAFKKKQKPTLLFFGTSFLAFSLCVAIFVLVVTYTVQTVLAKDPIQVELSYSDSLHQDEELTQEESSLNQGFTSIRIVVLVFLMLFFLIMCFLMIYLFFQSFISVEISDWEIDSLTLEEIIKKLGPQLDLEAKKKEIALKIEKIERLISKDMNINDNAKNYSDGGKIMENGENFSSIKQGDLDGSAIDIDESTNLNDITRIDNLRNSRETFTGLLNTKLQEPSAPPQEKLSQPETRLSKKIVIFNENENKKSGILKTMIPKKDEIVREDIKQAVGFGYFGNASKISSDIQNSILLMPNDHNFMQNPSFGQMKTSGYFLPGANISESNLANKFSINAPIHSGHFDSNNNKNYNPPDSNFNILQDPYEANANDANFLSAIINESQNKVQKINKSNEKNLSDSKVSINNLQKEESQKPFKLEKQEQFDPKLATSQSFLRNDINFKSQENFANFVPPDEKQNISNTNKLNQSGKNFRIEKSNPQPEQTTKNEQNDDPIKMPLSERPASSSKLGIENIVINKKNPFSDFENEFFKNMPPVTKPEIDTHTLSHEQTVNNLSKSASQDSLNAFK